jgi:serine/threonine-protein kinase
VQRRRTEPHSEDGELVGPPVSALKVCPKCGVEYPANARFCETDGTALRSANAESDLVGCVVADRYHVLRLLGEGGMGQVYLAEHVKMGRKCALKVMRPAAIKDVDAVSRFNREAANASRISHPNVATVYDFGETGDGIIYLAMELVDGSPLTSLIEEAGALPPKRAADITRQAAEGLAAAHELGIVHRDLKPENLMIGRTRDGADLVKIVDFGIAKAAGNDAQKVTKTGLVIGTPDYMSPEQLSGDPIDSRSDIYSLGIVAFNMLTGKLPFPSDSAQESMIMRLTDPPKRLSETRPEVPWPDELQAAVDKALARDVTDRYQQAVDFGRDLSNSAQRMSDGKPVAPARVARGNTVPETRVAPPHARKRPVFLWIGGGIAALLVVSAALYAPILRKDGRASSTPAVVQPPPSVPAAAATLDVDKELTQAESEAKGNDTTGARDALRRLAALDGRLGGAGDVARAALVRFEAYVTLNDTRTACAALHDVKDRARGTSYQRKVDDRLAACP